MRLETDEDLPSNTIPLFAFPSFRHLPHLFFGIPLLLLIVAERFFLLTYLLSDLVAIPSMFRNLVCTVSAIDIL